MVLSSHDRSARRRPTVTTPRKKHKDTLKYSEDQLRPCLARVSDLCSDKSEGARAAGSCGAR